MPMSDHDRAMQDPNATYSKGATIQAAHYGETERALADDPIIRAMAWEIPADFPLDKLTHDGTYYGTPRHEFMVGALREYTDARGGKIPTHIGGPSRAILAVLRELAEQGIR